MKLMRACFLLLAVTLPTSWTLAHAESTGAGGEKGGMTKKKAKKSKKKDGDMGDKKAEMEKK